MDGELKEAAVASGNWKTERAYSTRSLKNRQMNISPQRRTNVTTDDHVVLFITHLNEISGLPVNQASHWLQVRNISTVWRLPL